MNLSENCLFLKMRNKMKLNSVFGSFDTITKFIEIKDFDLFDTNAIEANVESWLNYYTYYHEKMHYYQFTSTSLGLFITCLEDLKLDSIIPFINELDFVPPFIDCVEEHEKEFNQKIYLMRDKLGISKYQTKELDYIKVLFDSLSEAELLMWIMEGGFSEKELELITKNTPFTNYGIRKIYSFISEYYKLAGKDLFTFYSSFLKDFEKSKIQIPSPQFYFVELDNGVSFGYNHILEAQARYCELTRLISNVRRFGDNNIHKSVKNILTKQDYYQEAYNIFKSIVVNIERCDQYFIIFVFCLICDYAINIPIPQIPQLEESYASLLDLTIMLPAVRFFHICFAVNEVIIKCDTCMKLQKNDIFNPRALSDWNKAIDIIYEGINKKTGYSSPITKAKAFIENEYKFTDHLSFDYDNIVFMEACKTRLQYPLFFINPELFRLIDRKTYIELTNKHQAPIMQLNKEIRCYHENTDDEMIQGFWFKCIISRYASKLFWGTECNPDLAQFFDSNKEVFEKAIFDKYGKVKPF